MTATPTRQPEGSSPSPTPPVGNPTPTRKILVGLAVVALLIGVWLAVVRIGLGDDAAENESVLELSMGEGDGLASCLPLDVEVLAGMSPAFAGTVTAVDGEQVTLAVSRWYTGGDAQMVVLQAPAGMEALIGGIDFAVGEQYLITASQGTVNYCGFSGPATPELTAAFDAAFGA